MTPLRVTGIAPTEHITDLKNCLADESINLLAIFEPDQNNLERIMSMPMDAVCMYVDHLDATAEQFIDKIYMARGRIGIFLLCPTIDEQTLSAAIGLGVTEVIDATTTAPAICNRICAGVERLTSRRASVHITERDSRVISLYGTKGGCGKTSLAVNLGVLLQKAGKLCVIVDLDLQFGDAADLFDIPQFETIADLANEPVVNAENITQYLYRTNLGVEVLCAPRSPELAELVRPELVERIVTTLRCRYDYIIFDLSPALEDCSLEAMDLSDVIYMVVNPEVPSIRNARTCLDTFVSLGVRDKVRLVVNKAGKSYVGPHDVEKTLHMKTEATIAFDSKNSSLAINRGVPVVECVPRSKMSKDLGAFAKKIIGKPKTKPIPEQKENPDEGLFKGRRFK